MCGHLATMLGSVSEKYFKKNADEVSPVFGSVWLRNVLYTQKLLMESTKIFLPQKKKALSCIITAVTAAVATWKKNNSKKSFTDWPTSSHKPGMCPKLQKVSVFDFGTSGKFFSLRILEALYIQT